MGSGAHTRDRFIPLRRGSPDLVDHAGNLTAGEVELSEEWDRLVADAGAGLAQTWDWGELKRESAWTPIRVGVRDRSGLVGGAQMLVRRVGMLGAIGYLDGGPLTVADPSAVGGMLVSLIEATCRGHRVRALIVDPPEDATIDASALEEAGYITSHVKTSLGATVRVHLRQSEEDLMSAMKSKTRYNIRKGLRSGVEVRKGTASDLPIFHRLLVSTAERQGFVAPGESYLAGMWSRLAPSGRLAMFCADVEGETVAGILITTFGDTAVYKRGAWDGRHGAAHPNEVLHWEAMKWARASGVTWYDFDGIEREVAESLVAGEDRDDIDSVTRFKLGFGGAVVLLPRSLTLVPNRVLRFGYRFALPHLVRVRPVKRLIRILRSR